MKDLTVMENVRRLNFERGWGKLELKNVSRDNLSKNITNPNPSFHVKQRTTGKVDFLFFKSFFFVLLTKPSFCQGDWALGYHSMKCRQFPDIL